LVAGFVSKRRPAPHLRAKRDLAFRIEGHSIEIFEIHPALRDNGEMIELSGAKATYNRRKLKWKVLWKRADMKWHGYQRTWKLDRWKNFCKSSKTTNTAASSAS
jgi:hypothetical protein